MFVDLYDSANITECDHWRDSLVGTRKVKADFPIYNGWAKENTNKQTRRAPGSRGVNGQEVERGKNGP